MKVDALKGAPTFQQRVQALLERPETGTLLRLLHAGKPAEELTYAQLFKEAAAWAELYQVRGLKRQDRIIIILKHSKALYTAYLGAMLAGFVPSLFAFPSPKFAEENYFSTLDQLLDNADASLIVTYSALSHKLQPFLSKRKEFLGILSVEDISITPRPVQFLDEGDSGEIAFVQYSSGTTGIKKGVAISHAALLWQIDQYAKAIDLRKTDIIASWLPLYHDMGLLACFFLPLLTRTPVIAMSPFEWVANPGMLLQAISDYRATLCWLPNFAYPFLAKNTSDELAAGLNLSCIRALINCSEPVLHESHQIFLNRFSRSGIKAQNLCTSYALAENTFAVTSGGFDHPPTIDTIDSGILSRESKALPVAQSHPGAKKIVSSGKPLPETGIRIMDDDSREMPDRTLGEIILRSPCLLKEYFRNPAQTKESIRDGWYWTGDLGYKANGELFVLGRKKDMLIIAGQNIYPQDLESIVNNIPGIIAGRAVALGIPDPEMGTENLVILAETAEQDPEKKENLRRTIFERLASATDVTPREVRLFQPQWLAKSTSGKLSRAANRERFLALNQERESGKPEDEAKTRSNETLQDQVRDCVIKSSNRAGNLSNLQDTASLTSTGILDSLSLVTLIAALENQFKVKIPASAFAESQGFDSIAQIGALIQNLQAGTFSASVRQNDGIPQSSSDIPMQAASPQKPRQTAGFWTFYYQIFFTLKGIRFGKGLKVLGPVIIRLDGDPRNISIGNNVTLMPSVDLKIRENGKIILHDGVVLDTGVRLVAANDARIELGEDTQIGFGTIINAGADVLLGRQCATAGFCTIIASEHEIKKDIPILQQPYRHAPVLISEGVWLAANVFVGIGTRVGSGAILGVKSVISGDVPANAIMMGNPARVIKFRN